MCTKKEEKKEERKEARQHDESVSSINFHWFAVSPGKPVTSVYLTRMATSGR